MAIKDVASKTNKVVATAAHGPAVNRAAERDDAIRKVTSQLMPITAMVYGLPKVGKTTFAGTFPTPLFAFVKGERGTHSLLDLEREDIFQIPVGSLEDLNGVLRKLPEYIKLYKIRTFVIDTGTLLGSMLAIQAGDYGNRAVNFEGWSRIKGAFLNVRDVVTGLGLHLVWVMHSAEVRDGERIVHYEPLLVGKALADVLPSCNIVCYLEKTVESPEQEGGEEEVIRNLWVRCPAGQSPRFLAGTHFDRQLTEPSYYPDWATLAKRLKGRVMDA